MLDNDKQSLSQLSQKWLGAANSTEPIERSECTRVVNALYESFHKSKPTIVHCQSPWQLVMMKTLLQRGSEPALLDLLRKPLNDPFAEPEERWLWTNLVNALEAETTPAIRKKLALGSADNKGFWSSAVETLLAGSIDTGLWSAFSPRPVDEQGALTRQINDSLEKAYKLDVLEALKEQYASEFFLATPDRTFVGQVQHEVMHNAILKDPIEVKAEALARLMPPVVSEFYHAVFAQIPVELVPAEQMQHELKLLSVAAVNALVFTRLLIGWLPFFKFLSGRVASYQLAIGVSTKVDAILDFCEITPCALLYENVCLISDRPSTIAVDMTHRLHAEDGPALTFQDGFRLYSWHGITIPRYIIEEPSKITTDKILREWNAEIRRIMMERFGAARFIKESGAKKVQEDECGALYRKDIPGREPWLMVKVKNSTAEPDGSFKEYFLRVPPEMQTAREAVAWTFHMSANEYSPEVET